MEQRRLNKLIQYQPLWVATRKSVLFRCHFVMLRHSFYSLPASQNVQTLHHWCVTLSEWTHWSIWVSWQLSRKVYLFSLVLGVEPLQLVIRLLQYFLFRVVLLINESICKEIIVQVFVSLRVCFHIVNTPGSLRLKGLEPLTPQFRLVLS